MLFIGVIVLTLTTQAQFLRGTFNSWSTDNLMELYYGYYTVTIEVSEEIIDGEFKIDQTGDWSLQWGYASDSYNPIVNTSEGQMRGSNSGDNPANFTKSFEAGKFYTFRLEGDETWWNRRFIIIETNNSPSEILAVSDNSESAGIDAVNVEIELNQIASAQETVYVRYSADDWSTSDIIIAVESDGIYIAEIPGQLAGTSISYYILTSVMPESFLHTNPDFATLRADNNEGENYSYIVQGEDAYMTLSVTEALNYLNLNGASLHLELSNDSFEDDNLDIANFVLNNAPTGLTVASVNYTDPNNAEIVLDFDGTEFTENITDFSVTILAAELIGEDNLTSNEISITGIQVNEGIWLAKVSMWEGGANDTWYDDTDFDGHNFGTFNSSMSLYLKSGQVFTWKNASGDIQSAAMNYRIYEQGDTPGDFIQENLPFFEEWIDGESVNQLWWNTAPNETDLNLLDGITEGTYLIEVYFEAENGEGQTIYSNNNGDNYISTFVYSLAPQLVANPSEQMTEENINGMVINLQLYEASFLSSDILLSNISLNNAPEGLIASNISYQGMHAALLTLAFDGTNFDEDYTEFSITIDGDELTSGLNLTSNTMSIIAMDESATIWSHLITTNNFEHTLGDNISYWINMEIGQEEWNGAQIGYGTINNNASSFNWQNAEWYEDGELPNKRVHSLITVPQEIGSYFYAGRVRNTPMGAWYYANNEDWSDTHQLDAEYTISVSDIPDPISLTATALDGTRILLEWEADIVYHNIIILASEDEAVDAGLIQGTLYNINDEIGNAKVIHKGGSGLFTHLYLDQLTTYHYRAYTINNNYYSSYLTANATTTDEEYCTFEIDLGDDVNICGGSAYVINPGLSISPFGDELTITYNATITGELVGEEKVYMHSGAEMAPMNGWEYVTGNWGYDDGVGLMTQIDDNIWQITIVPIEYYGYNPEMNMHGILMKFRNADGSIEAGNQTGEDIWVNMSVYPPQSYFNGVSVNYQLAPITEILWSDGSNGATLTVSQNGEYYLTAYDSFGCIGSDTINVVINPLPFVDLGGDRLICDEESIILNAGDFSAYLWNDESTEQSLEVSSSGMYSVTVTDENDCQAFDVVNINFSDYPVADFDYYVIEDMTIQFVDLSENAEIYSWDFTGNGVEDSNFAGDIVYTYSSLGQYSAKLTVSNDCGENSKTKSVIVLDIEKAMVSDIEIYPNPASEFLIIELYSESILNTDISITDLSGKTILTKKLNSLKTAVDIKHLSPGLYLLNIQNNETINSIKVIIK